MTEGQMAEARGMTLTVFVLLASAVLAAPVPVARPARELDPPLGVGHWLTAAWGGRHNENGTMTGSRWLVRLRPDGSYQGIYSGASYEGGWAWTKATRTLVISERPAGTDGGYTDWVISLEKDLTGKCDGVRVDFRP